MTLAVPAASRHKVSTVPAPVGGLNARDSLAAMPETDALVLNNWFPQPYGCQVRPGYSEWVTGLPGVVQTLATWASADGSSKLFAWAGTDVGGYGMYDVTAKMLPAAPALTPIVDTLSNARWNTIQTVNDAGTHLFAVNGVDAGILYNAAGVQRILYDAGPAPAVPADYTWYGLDSTTVLQLTSHQGRLWATKKNSSIGYYGGVDEIYTEFKAFDFGPQFQQGGFLSFITTWTIDDGNGAEDHLIAVSSKGDAVIYGGTDPGDISNWSLVGVYNVGEPVRGRRGYYKVGGDIILLTQKGLVSMADQLVSTKVNAGVNAVNSAKVQLLISALVSEENDLVDWELAYNAANNLFMINVPSPVLGGNRQLAANLVTDKVPWCFFTAVDAATWANFNNDPYFGDYEGRVCKFWDGNVDSLSLDGESYTSITTEAQQAYSYLGAPATQKQVGMYRPNYIVGGNIIYNSKIEYDFTVQPIPFLGNYVAQPLGATWDSDKWDQGRWGGGVAGDRKWMQAQGIGVAASLRLAMKVETEVLWVSTDYSHRVGGIL